MMTGRDVIDLLVLGPAGGPASAVGSRLIAGGGFAAAGDRPAGAVLVDAVDVMEAGERPFLELSDEEFLAAAVAPTVARAGLLQTALARATPDGAIVVLISDAYLGRWHGAATSAASAAMVGAVRSLAMERGRHGLRANAVALPVGREADDDVRDAAALHAGALLLGTEANGTVVLLDRGENLRLRQARRR